MRWRIEMRRETEIPIFERGGGDYQFKMGGLQAGMG